MQSIFLPEVDIISSQIVFPSCGVLGVDCRLYYKLLEGKGVNGRFLSFKLFVSDSIQVCRPKFCFMKEFVELTRIVIAADIWSKTRPDIPEGIIKDKT